MSLVRLFVEEEECVVVESALFSAWPSFDVMVDENDNDDSACCVLYPYNTPWPLLREAVLSESRSNAVLMVFVL